MRATSLIFSCMLVASTSAMALWTRQNTAPPTCATPCLNTGTNNVTLDGCAATDAACLCRSTNYVQGVINCFATQCPNHADVETSIQFSTSFCGVAGVNTPAPGLTTPLTQLHPSTAAPTSGSSSSPAPSSTSSRNAAGAIKPQLLTAVILAAVAAGMA